jgi:hypothetical protein
MRCFIRVASNRVLFILVDTALTKVMNEPGQTIIVHRADHYNHFHVGIADPDGTGN